MSEYWSDFPVVRGFDTLQPIYEVIAGRGYVAGSYAAFMACPHDTPVLPNDIDVFATTEQNAVNIAVECSKVGYVWDSENDTAITLWNYGKLPCLQIVKPNPNWKSFPDDILSDFDLDICRAVLISPEIVVADNHVGFMSGKILRVNNALRSMKRVMKYAARGVEFPDHELLKLFQAWEQMPAERRETMIAIAKREMDLVDAPESYYSSDDWFEGE